MISFDENAACSVSLWQALLTKESADEAILRQDGTAVSRRALIASARHLAAHLAEDEAIGSLSPEASRDPSALVPVGLMLPTDGLTMEAFFAVQSLGRIPAMLNFNAGAAGLLSACATARIHVIVTSRAFVDVAGLGLVVATLAEAGIAFSYIEDMQEPCAERPDAPAPSPNEPAVILFTSGSEGAPKGVALSHRNILANIWQFHDKLKLNASDKIFACLPLYHSFGLTVGALLPVLSGFSVFFYPTPLHYHEIPRLIRATRATAILGTSTFLGCYARCGVREDFESLRYVVAGAEKLKDEVRAAWSGKFGKEIIEGYGVTETAPVISVETLEARRLGSVGTLLSGIEARLEPIAGLSEGSMLWVKGPNVMLGYIRAQKPGVLQPLADGWHETGDVVQIDADGYLSILGRMKRFAKIAGEMISLMRIEQAISALWPDNLHVVLAQPHPHKGEVLVLLTDRQEAHVDSVRDAFRRMGVPDLAVPRRIVPVAQIPLLSSGKIDYVSAARMLEQMSSETKEASVR